MTSSDPRLHFFGIRHHGSGSARSLIEALTALEPDCLLVEAPPDAASILPLMAHPDMVPPVAILIHMPDEPNRAVYYPFAVFSPEWQAFRYGFAQQIPIRCMDLPHTHRFALNQVNPPNEAVEPETDQEEQESSEAESIAPETDPLGWLAQAAGYADGERWWNHLVEQRQNSSDLFVAILEAMTELRSPVTPRSPLEAQREAFMRKVIREALSEGFQRIAIVCGAWHTPALVNLPPAKTDHAILKGLPKVKVEATWVPWTYGRLQMSSGYGAGIESPGWYHHLWKMGNKTGSSPSQALTIRWMTRVARLLRDQDLDASSASVIEAVRLAESLAAMRDRPLPGLEELNEATQTVLCFGDPLPMQLIHQKLMVGERLGNVPDETPMVPLQQDLIRQQKRLRLKAEALDRSLDLDLRKPIDLDRSHLLHRLNLLGISWGKLQRSTSGKGTFHEIWILQWQPELAIALIEAGIWGNAIESAATAYTRDAANRATDLPTLTDLVDQALLANLPDAIDHLMTRLEAEAAIASDITHLMTALPPLANVLRYGNVRQLETRLISHVVDGLIARICIGLPVACASLNDEAAAQLYTLLMNVQQAIALLQNADHQVAWHLVLTQLADQQGLHGLLAGRCCRLLLEAGRFTAEEVARRLSLALSIAQDPIQAAAWVEGLLKGSGLLLLHNDSLWQILDDWVTHLPNETFPALLPLLRRTFSTFPAPERRQMGERVRQGQPFQVKTSSPSHADFDPDRAAQIIPLLTQLLGLTTKTSP